MLEGGAFADGPVAILRRSGWETTWPPCAACGDCASFAV